MGKFLILFIELLRVLPTVIDAVKGKERSEVKPIVQKGVEKMRE